MLILILMVLVGLFTVAAFYVYVREALREH